MKMSKFTETLKQTNKQTRKERLATICFIFFGKIKHKKIVGT